MMNRNRCSSQFESRIICNLERNGYVLEDVAKKELGLGVAVSGGADSVSLLVALCHICKPFGIPVHVISVDHNIRSAEESSGDAGYVVLLANRLKADGYDVSVHVEVLEPGKVFETAELRGKGVEEAARFLRYNAFEKFLKSKNCAFVALAHNKNDQIETLLMRFLQGSGTGALCGIAERRDFYVRPLLDISRAEIEAFLMEQGISFRTDKTNFDTAYLRNRIRVKLVPFLKENFPGFEKALISGAEKAFFDEECISSLVHKDFWIKDGDDLKGSLVDFISFLPAVRNRILFQGFGLLGCEGRVPFSVVKQVNNFLAQGKNCFVAECSFVSVVCDGDSVFLKKGNFIATESSFFAIIEENGIFEFPGFFLNVILENGRAKVSFQSDSDSLVLENIPVPFCIRSRQPDDVVETSWGGSKSVSDVLSDFCIKNKNSVPVLQELYSPEQKILAIVGCLQGGKNWILRECSGEGSDE